MPELFPLFSRPIYKTSIETNMTVLEKVKWAKNYTNNISESQNVLDLPEHSALKHECEKALNDYFYNVMGAEDYVKLRITESWFNKTVNGEQHHRHWHPNSLYSAIVYIESDPNSGFTTFLTSNFDTIEYDIKNANLYNSRTWSFGGSKGDMLIFPSNVEHYVTPYEGQEPRITLSFNTFAEGVINKNNLTRLEL